jgi:hypothetical protein
MTPTPELVADGLIEISELDEIALVGWAKQNVEYALGIGLNEAGKSRNSWLTTLLFSSGAYSKNT